MCPTGIHWMYDGHAFNTVIGRELTRAGHRRWYFLTVNNAFGLNVEASLAEIVRTNGGEVIGTIRHPIGSEDLFSELREASQAGAQVIALVNAGQDMIRAVRESADLLAVSRGKRCSQPPRPHSTTCTSSVRNWRRDSACRTPSTGTWTPNPVPGRCASINGPVPCRAISRPGSIHR